MADHPPLKIVGEGKWGGRQRTREVRVSHETYVRLHDLGCVSGFTLSRLIRLALSGGRLVQREAVDAVAGLPLVPARLREEEMPHHLPHVEGVFRKTREGEWGAQVWEPAVPGQRVRVGEKDGSVRWHNLGNQVERYLWKIRSPTRPE